VVSARFLIEGEKVQGVGYRIFLLEKALESGIEKIFARNVDKDKVELLISEEESKVNTFHEILGKEKPEGAIARHVKKEPYDGKIPIPSIDRYLQFLALEQLSRGREDVVRLPEVVRDALLPIASSLTGIDEKFDKIAERFGVFGEYAKGMEDRLKGIDDRLKGTNEKLDKLSILPEKLDTLPERFAEALGVGKKK